MDNRGDKNIINVRLLDGEKWWGGLVTDGIIMPYSKEAVSRSLCPLSTENQTMPFLVSNKGRYIWCDEPFDYAFKENGLTVESKYAAPVLKEGFSSLKATYIHASQNYFPPSSQLPDDLLFTHPQYNTWIELMYDQTQENILNYAERIISEGYPPGILMIDDNWQEDYGNWVFHPKRFSSPKKMVDKLHHFGFKVMLWVCPFVSADSLVFRTLRDYDYLVKDSHGNIAIREWWNGFSAILDFSNPKACDYFNRQLKSLQEDYGIDGFKFDAGDPQYYMDNDIIHASSHAQSQCLNYSKIGLNYVLNEFRGSFKTAGWPLVQRLCDKGHRWENNGLDTLIPNGLAQGLMGYSFNCPDMIGGGEYKNFLPENINLDEELVVRYAQCSALFPMMQFSAAPWRILSKSNAKICLNMAKLHVEFGEYILSEAKKSSITGEPIMRHMAYEYDHGYENITDQFFIGERLLVAPVIKKGAYSREVVLPEGKWVSDLGEEFIGPKEITTIVPIERLPYYKKGDIK